MPTSKIEQSEIEKNESRPLFTGGDVVQLKSGGPPMTILNVYDEPRTERYHTYWAGWFDGGGVYTTAHFTEPALNRMQEVYESQYKL